MSTKDSESRPLSDSVVVRIVATVPTFADRLASRIPRTLFGIRFCLIAVMAVLLLFIIFASGYAILTFARLQATTARLASADLPGLVGAQRITDTLVSLGEALHRAQSVESSAQHHRSMSDIRAQIGQLYGQARRAGDGQGVSRALTSPI